MTDTRLIEQLNAHENTDWFTVLPSQLLTNADRTSQTFEAPSVRGLILNVKITNKAGTISFVPKLQTLDPQGGVITWVTVAAALAADGTANYLIFDSAITNSGFTAIHVTPIPRYWRLLLDYTGTAATDKADTVVSACYLSG